MVGPRSNFIVFANGFDLLLQELAEHPPIARRPGSILSQKKPPDFIEAGRSLFANLPFEAQRHSGAHRPALDFQVHAFDKVHGLMQKVMEMRRNLSYQMAFEDFDLAFVEY